MRMRKRASLTRQRIEVLRSSRPDPAELGGAPADEGARTAVLVVHGMGQQLAFQTLDDVVWGLHREHERRTGFGPDRYPSSVGIVRPVDDQGRTLDRLVPRASLRVRDTNGDDQPVDLYECYWAPILQGAVGLKDVVGFLFDAGRNGLKNTGRPFERTMFGKLVRFPRERWTALWLWLALAVVVALILFNVVVTLVVGIKLMGQSASAWLGEAFINDASWAVLLTVGAMLLTLGLMWLLRWLVFLHLALLSLLAGGVLLLTAFVQHRLGWFDAPLPAALLPPWAVVVTWIVLLLGSWRVHTLLVQYVGDVAAYVQPHKLDKFGKVRAEIKAEARAIADVVYGMKATDGTRSKYDRVAIVGHSLGSVIAYDLLNDMLVRDIADGEPRKVARRTPLLLTFGSPLDKIVFLFKLQGSATDTTRENLAAARQPLILDYRHRRRLTWTNIYSRKDIISGPLDFFDDPDDGAHAALRVENLVDPACRFPLKAHVEYWDNPLVFERLYDALSKPPPQPPGDDLAGAS